MARLSVPTTARLSSTLRIESSNQLITKSLNRLSRETLISLALNWLDDDNVANALPFLEDAEEDEEDPDDLYPPCRSVRELQQFYMNMQQQKGSKRDVISRILEGDWRHGLTLYQLALMDFTYFDEHPTSQKWTAYKILPLELPKAYAEEELLRIDHKALKIPRFHPSTFLQNLQKQALPDVKAHYHFHRPKDLPVLLLRIFAIESPYNNGLVLSGPDGNGHDSKLSSSRTMYLAFPDGAASIYLTKFQTTGAAVVGESKNIQALILKGVPQALSRPRERYTLKTTNMTSKNMGALLDKRGAGRGNAAGGGWSIYADEKTKKSPLDSILPSPPLSSGSSVSGTGNKRHVPMDNDQRAAKRGKLIGKARFGNSGLMTDGKGVERVDVLLQDPFPLSNAPHTADAENETQPSQNKPTRRRTLDAVARQVADEGDHVPTPPSDPSEWRPTVKITFNGSHVFAGIRQLVEAGIVDGERMPGWMTGEDGVTIGVVRHGRIRGNQASTT